MPTPCHRLPRVSEDWGVDVWIKRDDLTGFAGGGNKGRKLEVLLPQVLAQDAKVVVTCGSSSSNFVRQLGAACSLIGVRCEAIVMDLPFEPGYPKPQIPPLASGGNETLNELFGTVIHRIPDGPWETLFDEATNRAALLREHGEQVVEVKIGGSSAEGVFAFRQAAEEISQSFDHLVVSSSSGSTLSGLASGFHGSTTHVIGISADPEEENYDDVLRLSRECAERFGGTRLTEVDLRYEYVGPGYGVASEEGVLAAEYLARREGIILDPVYSAKAFAGMQDLVTRKEIKGRILFWHTGGVPSVFGRPRT
ncbi:MAG: pyridoxal-phosphate dependent enzyme [Fimbriimonadaceae bacterium]|nr:pyridoxal-phosphate dependent enzyme [Fimbriimonadaceae bacterium]